MDICLFCNQILFSRNIPSYYSEILFCMQCPFSFYIYDKNIYFETNIYQFNWYENSKLFTEKTLLIRNKSIKILEKEISSINKDFILSFFNKCNDNDSINKKIESICTFI